MGGILVAQGLIRTAELRSIITQKERYSTAVNTFRNKYNALPGDLINASTYWGAADGVDGNQANCYTNTLTTSPLTCNGNGSGIVADTDITLIENGVNCATCEGLLFWQHLANAGLIEGTYGYNGNMTPLGKISSSQWWASQNWDTNAPSPTGYIYSASNWGNIFILQSNSPFAISRSPIAKTGVGPTAKGPFPILTPSDGYYIDSKIDDGDAIAGKISVIEGGGIANGYCASAAFVNSSATSASYVVSNTNVVCGLIFHQVY